jgi:hypothetical protein
MGRVARWVGTFPAIPKLFMDHWCSGCSAERLR